MPPVNTRECTEIFTAPPSPDTIFGFSEKPVERVDRFYQRVFTSDDRHQGDIILASLTQRLDEEVARKREKKKRPAQKPQQATRKEKVNKKREFIRRVLSHQTTVNIKEVARYTKSCSSTVKRVREEMLVHGVLTSYEYNFLKTPEQLSQLNETIDEVADTGMGVSDIKRLHPTFSKTKILEVIHERGLKYRPLPRKRKTPTTQPPNSTRVCRVISHLCQALSDPGMEILYCDEMKFPLCQTSTHAWTGLPEEERDVYNRRPDDRMLTAIAMCSTNGFVSVQVFKNEIKAPDFLFFMNKAIASLPTNKQYSVLLDNATWHRANLLSEAEVGKFFFFNEPRMFQLNIIENAFSFVRNSFRKRPVVESMEEEAKEIVKIFFEEENQRRFRGILRNHLRQLIKYHERHWTL